MTKKIHGGFIALALAISFFTQLSSANAAGVKAIRDFDDDDDTAISHPSGPVTDAHLTYQGGQIIARIEAITVYWGSYWKAGTGASDRTYVDGFVKMLSSSSDYFSVLNQYRDSSGASPAAGSFGGSYVFPSTPGDGKGVSDAQIQSQLRAWITAGMLPASNANRVYFVMIPPGIYVQYTDTDRSCAQVCGYHETARLSASSNDNRIRYTVHPYPDCAACNYAGKTRANLTYVISHELAEAVTDPDDGIYHVDGNWTWLGWIDWRYGEISDICIGAGVATLSGYSVAQNWSNADNQCLTKVATPDSLDVRTSLQEVDAFTGSSASVAVLTSGHGSTAASLSITGLPAGVTATFTSKKVAIGSGTTLKFTASASAKTGTFKLTLRATAGALSDTQAVTLKIAKKGADFAVGLTPASLTVKRGKKSAVVRVSETRKNGWSDPMAWSFSGALPAGVKVVRVGNAQFQLATDPKLSKLGSYTVTVVGTSGGKTHSAALKVKIVK